MPITFEPMWLSTVGHMDELHRIVRSASMWSKLIGRFDVPKDFPQMQLLGGLLFYSRVPLVFCQYGELTVGEGQLRFRSKSPRASGGLVRGHWDKLSFDLDLTRTQSVEAYQYPDPYMKWANVDWVRVRTSEDILGGDFLMCHGGNWPATVRSQTSILLQAIHSL